MLMLSREKHFAVYLCGLFFFFFGLKHCVDDYHELMLNNFLI